MKRFKIYWHDRFYRSHTSIAFAEDFGTASGIAVPDGGKVVNHEEMGLPIPKFQFGQEVQVKVDVQFQDTTITSEPIVAYITGVKWAGDGLTYSLSMKKDWFLDSEIHWFQAKEDNIIL